MSSIHVQLFTKHAQCKNPFMAHYWGRNQPNLESHWHVHASVPLSDTATTKGRACYTQGATDKADSVACKGPTVT